VKQRHAEIDDDFRRDRHHRRHPSILSHVGIVCHRRRRTAVMNRSVGMVRARNFNRTSATTRGALYAGGRRRRASQERPLASGRRSTRRSRRTYLWGRAVPPCSACGDRRALAFFIGMRWGRGTRCWRRRPRGHADARGESPLTDADDVLRHADVPDVAAFLSTRNVGVLWAGREASRRRRNTPAAARCCCRSSRCG
jgi:hypothetical protein